jgi:hypothetical protein
MSGGVWKCTFNAGKKAEADYPLRNLANDFSILQLTLFQKREEEKI